MPWNALLRLVALLALAAGAPALQAARDDASRTAAGSGARTTGQPPAPRTSNAHARSSAGNAKPLDRSGRRRVGEASFYADRFAGQEMADGRLMDHRDDNAASRTLPLGTRARVTNLETGRSAMVTIQDRGPYAKGRIIDLSRSTARQIGITRRDGVARVAVTPVMVPNAGVKAVPPRAPGREPDTAPRTAPGEPSVATRTGQQRRR
jgi:rare lipoprotein A